MKRWLVVLSVIALLLIAALLVTVFFVLRSDIPKNIVLGALRDQTGLRIDAAEVRTGWFGSTTITDLQVALPLEPDPFVSVPRIEASHNSLLWLALTRSVGLGSLTVTEPTIRLIASADGQWNIIEAANTVSIARERQPASGGAPQLPALHIVDAVVDVTGPEGGAHRYTPLNFVGDPAGDLAWDFTARLPDRLEVDGKLAPGAGWSHEIAFDVNQIRSLIEPFLGDGAVPDDLRIEGQWKGSVRDSVVAGSLEVSHLHIAGADAAGRIGVEIVGYDLRATPEEILIQREGGPVERLRIEGGRVVAGRQNITIEQVAVIAEGLAKARLDARWSLPDSRGRLDLVFRSESGAAAQHRSQLGAFLSLTPFGTVEIASTVESSGSWQSYSWDTLASLVASGESWQTLEAVLETPRLTVNGPDTVVNLPGMSATITGDWPIITLDDLRLPSAAGTARQADDAAALDGRFDAETMTYSLDISARDWIAPATHQGNQLPPLSIVASLRGDRDGATLDRAVVHAKGAGVGASGTVRFAGLALDARLSLDARDPVLGDRFAAESVRALINASGTGSPLDIAISGETTVSGASMREQSIGALSLVYSGRIEPDRAAIRLEPFDLLGGMIRVTGVYDRPVHSIGFDIDSDEVSIARLTRVLGMPVEPSGDADARIRAAIPLRNLDATDISGTWSVQRIALPSIEPIDGEGQLHVRNGAIHLADMKLRSAEGTLTGIMQMQLNRPDRLRADVRINDWPLGIDEQGVDLLARGEALLDIDLAPLGADGSAKFDLGVRYRDQTLGTLSIDALVSGRALTLSHITGQTLGGTLDGRGRLHLTADTWTASTFELAWHNLDLSLIDPILGTLDPLSGTTTGSLDIRPAIDPREVLPMQLEILSDFSEGSFAGFTIGGAQDDQPDFALLAGFSPERLEIRSATLTAADGLLDFYGRLTRQGPDIMAFANLRLSGLDLQQIATAAGLTGGPMPGRLSGEGSLGGLIAPPHRSFGRASLRLTDSDLLGLPGIAQLYSALRLDIGETVPDGEGDVSLRLEGDALEITRLTYFNRGTDVVASLRMENIWQLSQSPITGTAVGTARPLRGINLPFFDMLDRMLRAAQTGAAAVVIEGTIAEPETEVVPLEEITGTVRRLMGGDAH